MAPAGKDIWSWCLILPSSFSCLISTVLFPSLLQLFVYSYLTFGNPKISWLRRRKKTSSEDCRQFKTTLHHSNLREWLWSIYLQLHFHKHLIGCTATFCSASRRGVAYHQALGLVLKCAACGCTEGCTNLSIKSQWVLLFVYFTKQQ